MNPRDGRGSDLTRALDEVSASSAGGAPFLIAFGFTLALCAVASFYVPLSTAAWIVMFQGNLALPLAFWLERKLGRGRMAADNPLRPLSVLAAMSQIVALPATVIAFSFHPWMVPAALAAIGGGHFLPYAWLHRTPIYTVLGVAVSVGAFAITLALRQSAFPWVLFYISASYGIAAPFVMRHARTIVPVAAEAA